VVQEEEGSVRIEVLQRLAEQAMSDPTFREEANANLESALTQYGYDLRPQELALVLRFRRSLADAGVDLDREAQLMALFESLPRRMRRVEGA
jgi:hypothetical protein